MPEKDEKMKKYGNFRQVSFMDKEVETWLNSQKESQEGCLEEGLCLKRFHSDFITEGVKNLKVGDLIRIEGNGYEVTLTGKKCFPECRLLKKMGGPCPLKDGVVFGRPLQIDGEKEEE